MFIEIELTTSVEDLSCFGVAITVCSLACGTVRFKTYIYGSVKTYMVTGEKQSWSTNKITAHMISFGNKA